LDIIDLGTIDKTEEGSEGISQGAESKSMPEDGFELPISSELRSVDPESADLELVALKSTEIRRAAMDLLARREHSRLELLTKLVPKLTAKLSAKLSTMQGESCKPISEDSVAQAVQIQIDRLTEEGLQSDYRLAGAVIRSRSGRGHGPVKIGGELRQKGVEETVISSALLEEDIDWFEKAREVSHRKFGTKLPENSVERAKRGRFLQQRGFSWDQIQSI